MMEQKIKHVKALKDQEKMAELYSKLNDDKLEAFKLLLASSLENHDKHERPCTIFLDFFIAFFSALLGITMTKAYDHFKR